MPDRHLRSVAHPVWFLDELATSQLHPNRSKTWFKAYSSYKLSCPLDSTLTTCAKRRRTRQHHTFVYNPLHKQSCFKSFLTARKTVCTNSGPVWKFLSAWSRSASKDLKMYQSALKPLLRTSILPQTTLLDCSWDHCPEQARQECTLLLRIETHCSCTVHPVCDLWEWLCHWSQGKPWSLKSGAHLGTQALEILDRLSTWVEAVDSSCIFWRKERTLEIATNTRKSHWSAFLWSYKNYEWFICQWTGQYY